MYVLIFRGLCMKRFLFTICMFGVLAFQFGFAQLSECRDCPMPKHPNSNFVPRDSSLNIIFKDKRTPIYNVLSVKRSTINIFGRLEQSLLIRTIENGFCKETEILQRDVEKLSVSGLGLQGQTFDVPVYPAREYYRSDNYSSIKPNFVEITGNLGFIGTDESNREIGVDGFAYGAQILVAPFGQLFGNNAKLALGGGIMSETGRTRFPIMGHFRWNFMGNAREEDYFNYFPSPCKFGVEGEKAVKPTEDSFIEVPNAERQDSTVYFYRDKRLIRNKWRPYVFAEGGLFVDGDYEGAGNTQTLNPNDHGQYFLGVGAGMPFFDILAVNLSLRYMRTNVKTPCETCPERYIVNTNESVGVFLGVGIILEY